MEKAAEAIRGVVSMAILAELNDPRVRDVTVTYVEVSPDLRHAKVHVSVMGDEAHQKLSLRGLQSAAGFLQAKIAERIEIRYTPRIELSAGSRSQAIDRRGPDPATGSASREARCRGRGIGSRPTPNSTSHRHDRRQPHRPVRQSPQSPEEVLQAVAGERRAHGGRAPAVRLLPGRRPPRRGGRGLRGAGAHVLRLERGAGDVDFGAVGGDGLSARSAGRGQPHQARAARRLRGHLQFRPGRPAEEEPRPDGRVAGEARRRHADSRWPTSSRRPWAGTPFPSTPARWPCSACWIW